MIRPGDLLDPDDPPVRLLWSRPDLNLGCLAFLTGLVHTGMPPDNAEEWEDVEDSIDPDRLELALDPLACWFELDGEGPRFLQELGGLDSDVLSVDSMFIDSPGSKTAKDNADLSVRRNRYSCLARGSAAMALYTFQSFAPPGGRGNRTSMCGGGPLYAFVEPSVSPTLWELIWANVPYGAALSGSEEVSVALPWTENTRTSNDGSTVSEPETAREHHQHPSVWWGMPRRIILEFSDESEYCDLTSTVDARPVIGMRQVPYGINYGAWQHPASPYYRQKEGGELLPKHPKPGRFGYQHYRGIVLQARDTALKRRSATIRTFVDEGRSQGRGHVRVFVGGWAMDNMKPLDFVQSSVPIPLSILGSQQGVIAAGAVAAADVIARELSGSLKDVLDVDDKGTGAVSGARDAFYEKSEEDFHAYIESLSSSMPAADAAKQWLSCLRKTAISCFDSCVRPVIPTLDTENAVGVIKARRRIASATTGHSKRGREVFERLGLRPPERKKKSKRLPNVSTVEGNT